MTALHTPWQSWLSHRRRRLPYRSWWQILHLDGPLLLALLALSGAGLVILYSASGQSWLTVSQQAVKLVLAFIFLILLAQIPPQHYRLWAPWLYSVCLFMLIMVLALGVISKGSQRWLNLGLFRFQPSELMKLVMPLMLAWYFDGFSLPPSFKQLATALVIILVPVLLVAKQPDLGTALIIAFAGIGVILLAGIRWPTFFISTAAIAALIPLCWHFMHDYQKQRVLTLFNPERDPLGKGYHIIQSKIAIGSGGMWGKGWLHGSQAHLSFLPEHSTDFIFAVGAEEFGFMGTCLLIALISFILGRGLYITLSAKDTFGRLVAGSITLLFFLSAFVNIAMVSGLLPVVGIPLPLVSYGGTALVTFIACFGIVMSVHAHPKLVST